MNDQQPEPLYSIDLTLDEMQELRDLLENKIPKEAVSRFVVVLLAELDSLISLATAPIPPKRWDNRPDA